MENIAWIKGFEGKYQVSTLGVVSRVAYSYEYTVYGKTTTSSLKAKILGGTKLSKKGYPRVNLNGTWKFIHQVVAETFLPNPYNLPQINHIDGNKLNNNINNLEWVSNQENRDHAVKNLLHSFGEGIGNSKLTEKQISEIRRLYNENNSQKDIAKLFDICQQTVSSIVNIQTWKRVKD